MIFKNMEFFNVNELEEVEGFNGVRLQRLPKHIRDSMGTKGYEKGRQVSQHSTGCEIRFIVESNTVTLFLSTVEAEGEVLVYKGDYFHSRLNIMPGVITPVRLEEHPRFSEVSPGILKAGRFSSKVWRLVFNRYCAVFHGIETYGHKVRPPEKNETPKISWLAYGSSITHGSSSGSYENSYVQQASRRLGVDALCFGMSGSCYCEKELADYIALLNRWDIITLEVGVNMRSVFSPEEFEKRVSYLLETLLAQNPGKPVVLISIFPNYAELLLDETNPAAVRNKEFNRILKELLLRFECPELFLIEGRDILTDYAGLTCDLLHPSAYGHIQMGENLANGLRPIINDYVCSTEKKRK